MWMRRQAVRGGAPRSGHPECDLLPAAGHRTGGHRAQLAVPTEIDHGVIVWTLGNTVITAVLFAVWLHEQR